MWPDLYFRGQPGCRVENRLQAQEMARSEYFPKVEPKAPAEGSEGVRANGDLRVTWTRQPEGPGGKPGFGPDAFVHHVANAVRCQSGSDRQPTGWISDTWWDWEDPNFDGT